MKLEEIAAEASRLTEEERASLASQLLHGLDTPVYEVTDKEVAERMREAENDSSVWLTFDQLVTGLKRSEASLVDRDGFLVFTGTQPFDAVQVITAARADREDDISSRQTPCALSR